MDAIVFIVEVDNAERDAVQQAVVAMGHVAIPVQSIDKAAQLFKNGAVCDLLIISVEAVEENSEGFETLFAATEKQPAVIAYGVDPAAKMALHCLNHGASEFLAKPFKLDELTRAVESALTTGSAGKDSIVASSPLTNWIELTSSSQLEQLRRIQNFSDTLFAANFPDDVCQDLKMAVEEVGRNAVEWGNRFDPDKQVHVSYAIFDDRVVIKVEDEGEGFTPQNIPDPTADPVKTMQDRMDAGKRPGGYGVYMMQRLVDEIVYNEKGNVVLMIKYLPEVTGGSGDGAPQ